MNDKENTFKPQINKNYSAVKSKLNLDADLNEYIE